jgi:[acyl-carrier-protein] S-malonyltransferase
VATEALDLADGLRLVLERGRIMKDWASQRPGGLATILGLDEDAANDICTEVSPDGEVGVAAYNAPGQTVIAGLLPALESAIELARQKGARVVRLPISVPGHIPIMRDVAADLGRTISRVNFHDPQVPVVSNISARLLTTAEEMRQELSDQLCAAVEWAGCLLAMVNQGTASFVEVGPGGTLSRLARRINSGVNAYSLSEDEGPALRLASPLFHGSPP